MPFQYPSFELSSTEDPHTVPLKDAVLNMLQEVPSSRKAEMVLIKLIVSHLAQSDMDNVQKSKILLGMLIFIKKEIIKEYSGLVTRYFSQPENSTLYVEINKILSINDKINLNADDKVKNDKIKRTLECSLYNEFSSYFVNQDPLSLVKVKDKDKRTLEENELLAWMEARSGQLTDFRLDIKNFNLNQLKHDESKPTRITHHKLVSKDAANPVPFFNKVKLELGYDIYFMSDIPPADERQAYKSSYILNKEGLYYIRFDGGIDAIPSDKINDFKVFTHRIELHCHKLPSFHLSNKAVEMLITRYTGHVPEVNLEKTFEQHVRKQLDRYQYFTVFVAPLLRTEGEAKPWELAKMKEKIKEKMEEDPVGMQLAIKKVEQLANTEGNWVKVGPQNPKLPAYWLTEKAAKTVLKKMAESAAENKPFYHHSRLIQYPIKPVKTLKPVSERTLNLPRVK